MSLILSGKIETIKTNVATLLSRLTSGRASNLDNLDAAISTRAPSSTAVSNANYTSARATKLDFLDGNVTDAILRPPTALGWSGVNQDYRDGIEDFFDDTAANKLVLGHRWEWATYTSTISSTWVDLLNLTGPGIMQFACLWFKTSADANNIRFRVSVDGTVQFTHPNAFTGGVTEQGKGYVVAGEVMWDNTNFVPLYGGLNFDQFAFASSYKIQLLADGADSNSDLKCAYRWYPL